MINYIPFMGSDENLADPKSSEALGRFDMLDTAADDNIEIDLEGNSENTSLIGKA